MSEVKAFTLTEMNESLNRGVELGMARLMTSILLNVGPDGIDYETYYKIKEIHKVLKEEGNTDVR